LANIQVPHAMTTVSEMAKHV